MTGSLTIERPFHVANGKTGTAQIRPDQSPSTPQLSRIPRISRLMALAIRFDQLIRDGVVADQAELARVGHVSRARLTQLMNLLNLAPDIQEAILHLPRVSRGRDPVSEREVRPIAALADWREQQRLWNEMRRKHRLSQRP